MKMSLMIPRLSVEFSARAAVVVLVCGALSACGADGAGLGDNCDNHACDSFDASIDYVSPDASTSSDGGDAADIGSRRSPLCAVTGCFPGFAQACLGAPVVDAGTDDVITLHADPDEAGDEGDPGEAEEENEDGGVATTDSMAPAIDAANVDVVAPDAGALGDEASLVDASMVDASSIVFDSSAPVDAGPTGPSDAAVLVPFDAPADRMTSTADAGFVEAASDAPLPTQSCYVSPAASGVVAACALAGTGVADDACSDSANCSISLACVQIDGAGICRPFSCGLPPSCPPGSFYQLAPLVVAGVPMSATVVPVCVRNIPCGLLEAPSSCASGKVCAVVGNDGETSCVNPGPAKRNEYCDETTACGDGLVCAMRPDKTQNQCLQLCHVDQSATECPGGTCQGGNNAIPTGFGICVGDSPDGG
jgi:hypothetical protein